MEKEFDLNRAVEIFEKEDNITQASKLHCEELGIEYSEKYRNRLSRYLRKEETDNTLENEVISDSINYSNDKEKPQRGFTAIGTDGKLMNIESYCEFVI